MMVEKRRDIYFIDNVKFHLDEVEGLGTFVEIEAIDYDGTIGSEQLLAQCHTFLTLFDIQPDQLVAVSYSDLFLRRTRISSARNKMVLIFKLLGIFGS